MRTAQSFAIALCVAGCGLGRQDQERRGDVAWHAGRWSDAMAAYRAAGDSPRLTAKVADAALQAGLLVESAEAWTKLGVDAADRAPEAAAGLSRVAGLAEQDGREPALATAILGLRRIAPSWPVGRIAGRLGSTAALAPAQVADLVPALLAAAQGREAAEPLLLKLGQADRARGACELAVPLLEGVMRRTNTAVVRDTATSNLGWCELTLGLGALQAERPGDAERWLGRVAIRDSIGAVGRRARVGVGDARIAQGDTAAARLVWREVITAPVSPDSLTQLALTRLTQLPPVAGGDTVIPHPVRP